MKKRLIVKRLTEIMDRWKVRLTGFLFRHVGDETTAVDLAEETFVRVYQCRERYRSKGSFSSWLFGIAMNQARQHLRWKRRHPTVSLDEKVNELTSEAALHQPVDPKENPSQSIESRERANAVKYAVAQLPENLRDPLIFFEYEQMGHIEIAGILGCSPKAVERRISRARDILRIKLSKYLPRS